ncbi:MAG: hypothetical protein LUM44_13320 [Pyrinomonadaceae bacterium]|nr:hypothetical protein [Pyrinomonadaceae bacterium]
MKNYLFLIIALKIFVISIYSQSPPPPPPPKPLIYSAPGKDEIKEFESKDFDFKADFVGVPNLTQGKLIEGTENLFKINHKGSEAHIRVIDFDFNIEKSVDKDEIFGLFKSKYLDEPGNELVSEKDFSLNGKPGKEFEIKDDLELKKIRVLIRNDRIYEQYIDVTNWHILSEYNPDKVKAFRDEAARFFASFEIVEPVGITAAKPLKTIAKGSFRLFPPVDKNRRNVLPMVAPLPTNKIFESKSGGFKIRFPANPTETVSRFQAAFGNAEMHQFALQTTVAYYGINYFDFPTAIDDKTELKIRYTAIKEKLTALPGNRLLSENDLFYGENYGQEYLMENGLATMNVRLVTVKQRLFQIIVITNGNYSSSSETLKSYKKEIKDNFFNSFEVTSLPNPTEEAVNLPENFGVSVAGNKIKIDYFKFSMDLPEKWNVVSKAQTQLFKEIGAQRVQDNKNKEVYNLSLKNTEILFLSSKSEIQTSVNNAVLTVAAERSSFPNFLPKIAIETLKTTFIEENEKLVIDPTQAMIGGVEFYWIEAENTVDKTRQRIYIGNRKGLMFEIFFVYEDQEDLRTLLKSLESAKFENTEK